MKRELRNRAILSPPHQGYNTLINFSNKYLPPIQIHSPKHKFTHESKSKPKSSSKNIPTSKQKSSKNPIFQNAPQDFSEKSNKAPQNSIKFSLSKDKQNVREKQFKRKNNKRIDDRLSKSKKESKRSTENENDQTLIERLRAENQFYRQAYLTSKQNFGKLQKVLREEKYRRSHQKQLFRSQIDTLKKKLSVDKIKLCHIFTFEAFESQEISNMIVETENESSSIMVRNNQKGPVEEDYNENLSDLSIESK